jgi:hypothetical protein
MKGKIMYHDDDIFTDLIGLGILSVASLDKERYFFVL